MMPLWLVAQSPFSAPLPITGYHTLGVSPSEKLWIVTKPGDTFYSNSIDSLWHYGPIKNNDEYSVSGGIFEKISFFTNNDAIISGYIHGKDSQTNFIYRTQDSGNTWEKVIFGKDSWIDAAWVTPDGKAWMSGSSQLIYYSDDFGKSWKEIDKIETKGNLRFSTIHFTKDAKVGLFGTFGNNKIYSTLDNCKTWQLIPTPLNQRKYIKLSKEHRPSINKIRITANKKFYFIDQQNKIFYTKSDTINWQRMPGVIDFEVAENGATYVVNKELGVELLDENLLPVWKSADRLEAVPISLIIQNNILYALTAHKVYRITKENIKSSELLTNDVPIEEPYLKVQSGNTTIGFSGDNVLLFDNSLKQWFCYMKIPFNVGMACIYDNKIIISDNQIHNYNIIDINNRSILPFNFPAQIIKPEAKATSIIFESGSSGCFHNMNNTVAYTLQNDIYQTTAVNGLQDFPETISKTAIDEILGLISLIQNNKMNSKDFNFTENDISNFIKFIDASEKKIKKKGYEREDFETMQFPGEKTDFEFYRRKAREINTTASAIIESAFAQSSGIWSTTTNWLKITCELNNGTTLNIINSDYNPKYFYSPWVISYSGLLINGNSILIGEKIDQITKGKFLDKKKKDKTYAIFEIVDFMYRETLKDN